ncbi:MAG: hypothetical protein ACOC33_00790 [bacterium]
MNTTIDASEKSVLQYVDYIVHENPIIKEYCNYLYNYINPNITGFNLVFMVPPHLSGTPSSGGSFIDSVAQKHNVNNSSLKKITHVNDLYSQGTNFYLTFAAADYSPPQTQIVHAQISSRTGGVPYASDVTSSENCNVTYVDNIDCVIYLYHLIWVEYIRAIINGGYNDGGGWIPIKPASQYLNVNDSSYYGTLDYAASIYIVKYKPNMTDISYISKSIGCIPVSLPSKELIGTKATNELALIPFDYIVGGYREYVRTNGMNKWLFDEFNQQILANQPVNF